MTTPQQETPQQETPHQETPHQETQQPRDIALELQTPEQVADLEAQSDGEKPSGGS